MFHAAGCAVLHIGPQFSRNLHTSRTITIQLIVDGRNSNVALISLGHSARGLCYPASSRPALSASVAVCVSAHHLRI
jgi:hypothetical protein